MLTEAVKNLLTLLAGAIALYASITYMLQSRHHGIDEHERRLQRDFNNIRTANLKRWREFKSNLDLQRDEEYRYAVNILDQILIIRKRYRGALFSFIMVMVQLLFLIIAVCYFALPLFDGYWKGYPRTTLIVGIITVAPGILSLGINICLDLAPAFKTQRISRAWLDHMTEVDNGQLRPRLGSL